MLNGIMATLVHKQSRSITIIIDGWLVARVNILYYLLLLVAIYSYENV